MQSNESAFCHLRKDADGSRSEDQRSENDSEASKRMFPVSTITAKNRMLLVSDINLTFNNLL